MNIERCDNAGEDMRTTKLLMIVLIAREERLRGGSMGEGVKRVKS